MQIIEVERGECSEPEEESCTKKRVVAKEVVAIGVPNQATGVTAGPVEDAGMEVDTTALNTEHTLTIQTNIMLFSLN